METRRLETIARHLCAFEEVCIVGYGRSPIHKYFGVLSALSAIELAANTLSGTLKKFNISSEQIDEIYLGNVFSQNLGQAPTKQVAAQAGLPDSVACHTVNKLCASGMKAIMLASLSIAQGHSDCAVAGGMESMSNAPYLHPKVRDGLVRANQKVLDSLDCDAFIDPFSKLMPASISDKVSQKLNLSRKSLDEYSELSNIKAKKA